MDINITNYEEYFLLYIDNELSVTEKKAVESFLHSHPELEAEMEMLKEVVLTPALTPEFHFDKTALYKNEQTAINSQNYEEHFLLYIDNELEAPNKKEVETYVLQHPQLQEEFTLLRKTKLEPETIVCPKKEKLYKKERAIIFMQWARPAVAAILIGLCYLGYNNFHSEKQQPSVAIDHKLPSSNNSDVISIHHSDDENGSQLSSNNASTAVANEKKLTTDELIDALKEIIKANKQELNRMANEKESASVAYRMSKADSNSTHSLPIKDSNALVRGHYKAKFTIDPSAFEQTRIATQAFLPEEGTAVEADSDNSNKQVVYKHLNTNEDASSITLGSIEFKKAKLRGFFRRAAAKMSYFTANSTDNNSVAIATFDVKK